MVLVPAVLLLCLWLLPPSSPALSKWTGLEASAAVWKDELQNHTFQHTVYCQIWSPKKGFSETYDGEQLFSFDFDQNTRVPRLPEFADWAQKSEDTSKILLENTLCMALIDQVGPELEGQIPLSRGLPIVEVFTLKPLEFGKPNTLICHISNLYPPALTVKWQHHSVPVEGAGPTLVSAVDGLSFQAFSYLNVTPAPSDVYLCIVSHDIDDYTAKAYWVPRNALPSNLLENVLCGVAFGLGILGIIVGLILIFYVRKPCSG
ncbi:HLA class II histocompatibility antigen, DM alpha chain [Sorex araneus]|uniref:HLA class II histocompatibility antigen, DM alpha chain n=1 Tax=Sorex araneus TaxID=42254 RepID=UPI00243374E1|nr:HLA class II histocompatibility antigen, DM alpha chain [Sorex araneus]